MLCSYLYYIFVINTIIVLSIFNYLRKFDGRVLHPRSQSKGFFDALDNCRIISYYTIDSHFRIYFFFKKGDVKKLD